MEIKKISGRYYKYKNNEYQFEKPTQQEIDTYEMIKSGEAIQKFLGTLKEPLSDTESQRLREMILEFYDKFMFWFSKNTPISKQVEVLKKLETEKEERRAEQLREMLKPAPIDMKKILDGKTTWQEIKRRESFEKSEKLRKFLKGK